jgi:hypothetical protein
LQHQQPAAPAAAMPVDLACDNSSSSKLLAQVPADDDDEVDDDDIQEMVPDQVALFYGILLDIMNSRLA